MFSQFRNPIGYFFRLTLVVAMVSVSFVPQSVQAARTGLEEVQVAQRKITRTGEVYLIRGLANIFSLGMDSMAKKLRDKGVKTRTFNHSGWKGIANEIIARAEKKKVSYPIIIAGHSLGANSSTAMANYLTKNGVKVSLVVAFDPTIKRVVMGNVRNVVNYYLPNGNDNEVFRGKGFRGKLRNVDVSDMKGVNHMNVEKNKELQTKFVDMVMRLTKRVRSAGL